MFLITIKLVILSELFYVSAQSDCQCVPKAFCQDDLDEIPQGPLDIRSDPMCNNMEICCENPIDPEDLFNIQLKKYCGVPAPFPVDARITGNSKTASFGESPWTVALLLDAPSTLKYICGGSLIHPQVVLTAAHCVTRDLNGNWLVRAGEWDTKSIDEPLPAQDQKVKEIIMHPMHHPISLKNDIALLILEEPFDDADNVHYVCLPPSNFNPNTFKCTASGWGKDAYKTGKHATVLKMVDLPIVENAKCQMALRKTRLGNFFRLHKSFLCAGGEGEDDTCEGDGGSPLVCPIPGQPGRFVQTGIVSWGIGCGQDGTPGVYVNVALFRKWIDKQLSALNLDINLYNYL